MTDFFEKKRMSNVFYANQIKGPEPKRLKKIDSNSFWRWQKECIKLFSVTDKKHKMILLRLS